MKIRLIIMLFLIGFYQVNAQKISDFPTLESALKTSEEKKKPILVIVYPPPSHSHTIKSAHLENEVLKKIKSHFLLFETTVDDKAITPTLSLYKIRHLPAFVFMHATKDVFYSESGANSHKERYLKMVDKALSLSKETLLSDLEKDYLADKSNNEKLRQYIDARKAKGVTDNADLIEEFAKNLKPKDINDYQTILYILKAAPYAYGNAHKLAMSSKPIYDSIYSSEPLKDRIAINQEIIANTLKNAIKNKDSKQAYHASYFARAVYNDKKRGEWAYSSNMISYYRNVGDTSCYLKLAVPYYDKYYMTISADSIKKYNEINRIAFAKEQFKTESKDVKIITRAQLDSIRKKNDVGHAKTRISNAELEKLKKQNPNAIQRTATYAVVDNNEHNIYANTLNSAAWNFYETGTKNANYLTRALLWSRRSIELDPKAAYFDTSAHLLYKLGYETEAIKTQEEAIAKAKMQKTNYASMQESLKKMKNKVL